MTSIKTFACVFFLLVVASAGLMNEMDKDQWNPFDIFSSKANNEDSSDTKASELHEEVTDSKNVLKESSKHEHKAKHNHESKGKVRRWEKEEDLFERPPWEFCEASCTSESFSATGWVEKCAWTSCQGCDPCTESKRNLIVQRKLNSSKMELEVHQFMGDRTPPRMLVSLGCDGSSAVMKHANVLLKRHGVNVPGRDEVLGRQPYDIIKQNYGVNRTLMSLHTDFTKNNQTLVFRGNIDHDRATILSKSLKGMGTLAVLASRRNLIDQSVCMVKDCFAPHMGYPVVRGVQSDLCIKRRQPKTKWMREEYKAFLNVSALFSNIENFESVVNSTSTDLKGVGYTPVHAKTEDLLDFEWSEDMLWTAVPAWKRLFTSWGVEPVHDVIVTYLKENMGTREPPLSHKDAIFNYDKVKEEMKDHAKYSWMLRA